MTFPSADLVVVEATLTCRCLLCREAVPVRWKSADRFRDGIGSAQAGRIRCGASRGTIVVAVAVVVVAVAVVFVVDDVNDVEMMSGRSRFVLSKEHLL